MQRSESKIISKLIILILFYLTNTNYSQISLNDNQYLKYKYDFLNKVKSQNLNSEDHNSLLYSIAIPITATGIAMLFDQPIRVDNKRENNDLMKIGHTYGRFYYTLAIAGALYSSEFLFEKNKVSKLGGALFKSLFIGGLASISLKYIFGRSRPYREKGNTDFHWFESNKKFNSFPSGDVITAFTTSTVLSNFFDNKYTTFLLYGLSGLTVYQRIASDNHWFSDTVLSSSIGIIAGNYFSNFEEDNKVRSIAYNILPFASAEFSGLLVSILF